MTPLEGDELGHLVKQLVQQAMVDQQVFRFGYISNYDPATHHVRCIIPSMRDENGVPTVSPWMPLGASYASAASAGVQVFPQASATLENLTGGEQCMIVQAHPLRGTAAVPCMFFSAASPPPAAALPDGRVGAPGDILTRTAGGSLIWMHDSTGDIEQIITGKLIRTVTCDANITTQGAANITATGTANVTGSQVMLNGGTKGIARIGDTVSGGVITSGSTTVFAGG
jgi:hypothetical protein